MIVVDSPNNNMQVTNITTTSFQVGIPKIGRCDKWPEGFFDQWGKALMELL